MNYLNQQRSLLSKVWFSIALLATLVLSGCNGHSDDVTIEESISGTDATLSIAVRDALNNETNSFTSGNLATVSVSLVDLSGVAISGQQISFSTDSGTLSSSSRLTATDGTTSVSLNTSDISAGVVTVTATTTIDDETLSIDTAFEVLSASTTEAASPELSITLKRNGLAVNRFKANESAQLGVMLVDENNVAIPNTIISFSAEIGSLNASSALTNSSGLAEVELSGNENDLGAALATISATINDITYVDTIAYEIVAADALDENTTVLMGSFDDAGNFTEGEIKSALTDANGNTEISAGATLGLSVALVDENFDPITSATTISFSSTCVTNGDATIDATSTTVNGIATSTFQDVSCAGAQGNEDTVVATVRVNSADLTATKQITLSPESLGSVEFVSASPSSIVLKGTGGQGKQETSTVTFLVKGQLGNPLSQQEVNFTLNTDVGGLTLASDSGVTNNEGLVSAKVVAGTVPTAVRVTATTSNANSNTVATQSDLLSVNTGLPDQNSLTLSLSTINPEARNITGTEVTVRAYLADSFNNPVPDGTTVNFTTEGGAIEPSCTTVEGNCAVTWTSQEPYPDNHRVTILATAEGHEYFVDVNGDNVYGTSDGDSINGSVTNIDEIKSGLGRISPLSGGFIDMPEAWRDDNENYSFDSGELFIDSDNSGDYTIEDSLFNGPQCQSGCATAKFSTIRKARVLITSSSNALYQLLDDSGSILRTSDEDVNDPNIEINIPRGGEILLVLEMSDEQFQTLPSGTEISIASSVGLLINGGTFLVANTVGSFDPSTPGTRTIEFKLKNNLATGDESVDGALIFSATVPSGRVSGDSVAVTLE
ncbi:Ig-like protein, group 1 [Psychrosphaera haliotis]|uniref:Ig-like protein, group 1 n=1 Tax=Psychrosphaera haliotis TaxID=555083 RepID=A0A6N8FD27_9GAMM|nr:Ig-like protein, group 1 [Psychrosphaera haliotis]MUH72632.1 Ig-like protein, group 1 [Psychrosphaera haliotis]